MLTLFVPEYYIDYRLNKDGFEWRVTHNVAAVLPDPKHHEPYPDPVQVDLVCNPIFS